MSASRYVKTLCSLKLLQNKVNFELDLNQSVNLHLELQYIRRLHHEQSRPNEATSVQLGAQNADNFLEFPKKIKPAAYVFLTNLSFI